MKYIKCIFVVLLICSLTSFISKGKSAESLEVGDAAPDFLIETINGRQVHMALSDLKGKCVLLSFWASYDAQSRMLNASLSKAFRDVPDNNMEMVSISFDRYESIFEETVRKDRLDNLFCFVDTTGITSEIFKDYRLDKGFTSYILDDNGVIVAKDVTPQSLADYMN